MDGKWRKGISDCVLMCWNFPVSSRLKQLWFPNAVFSWMFEFCPVLVGCCLGFHLQMLLRTAQSWWFPCVALQPGRIGVSAAIHHWPGIWGSSQSRLQITPGCGEQVIAGGQSWHSQGHGWTEGWWGTLGSSGNINVKFCIWAVWSLGMTELWGSWWGRMLCPFPSCSLVVMMKASLVLGSDCTQFWASGTKTTTNKRDQLKRAVEDCWEAGGAHVPVAGGWNLMNLDVSSNPGRAVILWNHSVIVAYMGVNCPTAAMAGFTVWNKAQRKLMSLGS